MCFKNTGWLKFKFSLPGPVTHYGFTNQPYMAPVMLLQSRTSLLIWQGRKKPQWHLGHSHCYHANITFVSATALIHHIFLQWVMTWISYGWVLIITIIREILFSRKRRKNAFWKSNYQQPLEMYALKAEDSLLREWLLITASKLLTIWFNNQSWRLRYVLATAVAFSLFAYLYQAQKKKNA